MGIKELLSFLFFNLYVTQINEIHFVKIFFALVLTSAFLIKSFLQFHFLNVSFIFSFILPRPENFLICEWNIIDLKQIKPIHFQYFVSQKEMYNHWEIRIFPWHLSTHRGVNFLKCFKFELQIPMVNYGYFLYWD